MEGSVSEKQEASSYTYWVREVTNDAAPLPVPRKLTPDDLLSSQSQQPAALGSVWNRAGTWEEKNLNKWATDRIKLLCKILAEHCLVQPLHMLSCGPKHPGSLKMWHLSCKICLLVYMSFNFSCNLLSKIEFELQELLKSVGSLEFSGGKAEIAEVSKCVGDAFLVTVRNKKRVGYTYELTLKVKGEWIIREEKKMIKGHIDIPEFSFGELDDLQMEVTLNDEKDLLRQDKLQIGQDLKQFLQPVREKLLHFEQELKDR